MKNEWRVQDFTDVPSMSEDPRRENPKGNKEIWESREMS